MVLSSKQVSSDHLEFNWSTTTQNMIMTQSSSNQQQQQQRSTPPTKRSLQTATQQQSADPLKCPRCDSTNTKFCYYNNYNKTQPRHFCKACKRHWTKGGTLRNVPVGGSGRKNKRIKRPATTTTVDHFRDQKYMMFPADDDNKGNLFFKPNEFDQVSSWDFNMQQSSSTHQNLGFSVLHHQDLTTAGINNDHHTNPPAAISIINPPTSFAPLILSDHDSTRLMMIPDSSSSHEAAYMQVPVTTTTSNFLEPSYWSWNDIDSMVQADLNKPCL